MIDQSRVVRLVKMKFYLVVIRFGIQTLTLNSWCLVQLLNVLVFAVIPPTQSGWNPRTSVCSVPDSSR